MNKKNTGHKRGPGGFRGKPAPAPRRPQPRRPRPPVAGELRIVERTLAEAPGVGPFRIVIAVHRPRFRGRAERAAALVGWEVTALLNKQDPVGLCAKAPRPPDLLVLSEDFGRQKDMAIFRAVQRYRSQGMRLIGMVEDCATAPDGFPDSVPHKICDVCIAPPYKTAELRALFARLYTELRGEPAPPPISHSAATEDAEEALDE
jgi:hypothetical protein